MAELTDTLAQRLQGDLKLNSAVQRIERTDHAYQVVLNGQKPIKADAVVLATPAFVTADLVRHMMPDVVESLNAIRYVSTGTISLAFRSEDLAGKLDGFGLLVPRSERRPINAITWSSTKFNHRAPEDYGLLRVYFGGSRSPQSMDLDDSELMAMVSGELKSLLEITARPLFHRIHRWYRSNPQYDIGHLERVAAIEQALPPGLHVTGSAYHGVGIPDCVKHAQETAQQVVSDIAAA